MTKEEIKTDAEAERKDEDVKTGLEADGKGDDEDE